VNGPTTLQHCIRAVPLLWISSPPAPDSGWSLRRAAYPQHLPRL